MTSKEALKQLCEECHKNIIAQESKGWLPHKECPFRHISNDYCENYEIIKKDLELLNLYKKFFKYSLNEVFDAKYLIDSKRPDIAIPLTDDEYELLKWEIEMTSNKTSEVCEPMVSPDRYHEAQHEIETLKEIIIELNKKILELKNLAN